MFIHEGGHFLVAKICKVGVIEFAIGFGPKLYSKEIKNTKYTLRAIPLGGYVELLGMDKQSDAINSYSNASFLKKILIILAGSFINIVFGLLVYFVLVTIYNDIPIAFEAIKQFIFAIFQSLVQLFSTNFSMEQLMGPVGISEMIVTTNGFTEYFYILALISVSLGITNLLPIPPLDGGKLLFLLIEKIRRKALSVEAQLKIEAFCFLALITLSIYVTINDITNIF